MNKRLVIIDGKSIFYRGYYAMPGLATKDGTPTGGVFGFTTLSLEVIKRLKPDYVAVAWDKPKTNIRARLKIYPAYKAGRKPAPPDFYEQIPILHNLLEAFGWPLYELDDYEADDIMATLATQARKKNIETILITSDLDVLQCINGHVKVYALKKGLSRIEEFHPASFEAKYGIEPEQYLDYKSLKGDSSDNIPGVPGIGEKTALALLKKYYSLDEIYNNIDLIDGRVHELLLKGKDSAYLSKKLATLFTDAPIKLDLKTMDINNFDANKLKEELINLEFRSLLRQLPEINLINEEKEAELADGSTRAPRVVAAELFNANRATCIYVYAYSRGAQGADPYAVILGTGSQVATFILPQDIDKLRSLKHLLETTPIAGYDVKSHLKSLFEVGIYPQRVAHDVQVAAFLLDSLRTPKTLHDIAKDELGYQNQDFTAIPPEDVSMYAAELVNTLCALHKKQAQSFEQFNKMTDLANKIEWPVIPVLARMECKGIKLDVPYLKKMGKQMALKISRVEENIYKLANQTFNISSPMQLAKILFEDMGLPTVGIKKGKTGYSTAAGELDKLRSYSPVVDLISQYRELTKLKNTYIDALPKLVAKDGRIHTTFNLNIAQTGRLSSSDPNLQNIPVRSELGKTIRAAFVADKGKVFVSADYSQFELRLAAVMANDADMMEVFNSGEDIHIRTASEVYGVALEDVTEEQRNAAKTINFGVLYGMSPHGLAAATGMTFNDAQDFIDRYFASRQPLVDYIQTLKEHAANAGYVATVFGRRRPTPDVKSPNYIVREAALRQAVNMPIQGTEADLMKMAMAKLEQKFDQEFKNSSLEADDNKPRQLLQIHDSLLVECLKKDAQKVSEIMKDVMENVYPGLGIVLAVEVRTGQNWGEL
ncbi:MAG TPA: DNA polymerase I [Candidatus Saccharibacteria bacterium]|nr:DNA polymerase I [Candidatus Saccharibacteria bacterium]